MNFDYKTQGMLGSMLSGICIILSLIFTDFPIFFQIIYTVGAILILNSVLKTLDLYLNSNKTVLN